MDILQRFARFRARLATLYRRAYRRQRGWDRPVLIYQMGKVASSSVAESIGDLADIDAFHVHRLSPRNILRARREFLARGATPRNESRGLTLYRRLIRPRSRPIVIITLVREPIARNISAYFQNLHNFKGTDSAHLEYDSDQLAASFLEEYPHEVPLEWFDRELRATTGIDVFRYRFPHDHGYRIITERPFQVLVMRHDLDDRIKERLIAELLHAPRFRLRRANESANKSYAESYRALRDSLRLPVSYLERMLDSRYARHFYSRDELRRIRSRWLDRA